VDIRALLVDLAVAARRGIDRVNFDLRHFDSLDRAEQITFVVTAAAVLVLLIWVGRVISERRLQRWCRQEGFELLDWRRAYFFEGPNAWWRSKYQVCYRIEVRDHQGYERIGYIVFGSYWIGWPLSRRVRVTWD
jgi:hypothetical protein